jgi:uncharacterized membrane protein YqjE
MILALHILGGWFEASLRISESIVALVFSRFELFTVGWLEEKLQLLNLLVRVCAAAAIGGARLLVGLATLAFWWWAVAAYADLIGLVMIVLTIAGSIVWGLSKKIQTGPPPFAQTLAEFRKDSKWLGSK